MMHKIIFLILLLGQTSLFAQQEQVFVHTDKDLYLSGETIWMAAYCFDQKGQASDLSKVLYLELLDEQALPVVQERISLQAGTAQAQFFVEGNLNSGIYYLKAYTTAMRNAGPEHFFEAAIRIVHPFRAPAPSVGERSVSSQPNSDQANENLVISTDQKTYRSRSEINLNLAALNHRDWAQLSVSVHKYDPKWPNKPSNIQLQQSTPNNLQADNTAFEAEILAPRLEGQVEGATEDVFVLFPGENARIFSVPLSDDGSFSLLLPPQLQQKDMLFWGRNQTLKSVEIKQGFAKNHQIIHPIAWEIDSNKLDYISALSRNAQINNAYLNFSEVRGKKATKLSDTYFYGDPDWVYVLDDYTRFPVMEEVFLEILNYVSRRDRRKDEYLDVNDLYANENSISSSIHFEDPALVMIDGIPIEDVNYLWDYDPLKIERVEIVGRRYIAGEHVFYGVVNFITYKHNFGGQPFPDYIIEKKYKPLVRPRQFSAPNYLQASQERIPDFRSLLHWEAGLTWQTDQDFIRKFYSGDDSGHYRVVINGLTQSGQRLFGSTTFEVN
ncbi:MAG: hypothetical protein AB8H47_07910 [Bacteroidia bacterium]